MNPLLGVFFHWVGGLASASFYIPYRGVRGWAWETYWLAGGVFSWLIAPLVLAFVLVPDPLGLIGATPASALAWAYLFGMLWGIGGLTFGLTMRYLGIGLGMAVALGFCSVFGTLMPPIFDGTIGEVFSTRAGQYVLLGVAVCAVGIAVAGWAGMSKEKELSPEQKKATIREFNFKKGLAVAVFSGVMSSCMAYALAAGKPLAAMAREALVADGRSDLWQNLPVLIVVLWGGFTSNFIWCVLLNVKNRTGGQYFKRAADTGLLRNYCFCALAGVTWYLQFFFYGMGETRMGRYGFSSWTLHMASIIIFSTLWGVILHEWRGTTARTRRLLWAGVAALVAATLIVGYGNYLNIPVPPPSPE